MNNVFTIFDNITICPLDNTSTIDYEYIKNFLTDKDIVSTMSLFDKKVGTIEQIKFFFDTITCKDKKVKICLNKVFYDNNLAGIIGLCNVFEIDNKPVILELGYFLKKDYRNKGITSKVSEILINDIFQKFPNTKIIAGNLVVNTISQKILLKLGFKFKMKMRNSTGAIVNRFELTREDFLNRKNYDIDIEKELKYIKDFPESDILIEDYAL